MMDTNCINQSTANSSRVHKCRDSRVMRGFGIILHSLLLLPHLIDCIVYLRPWNEKGPAAVKAGTDCIEQIEKVYFRMKSNNKQVPILSVFHGKHLSSPAMEIKGEYLINLHDRILHQKKGENSFQLKIISDDMILNNNNTIMDLTLTGFYIIVTDDIENVSVISL